MSEVKAGLADGGDGGLIGWLGPVTSFPKLLILGEETGEGGGCRRRVKGRKKRMIVSCVNVWSRGRMEGD